MSQQRYAKNSAIQHFWLWILDWFSVSIPDVKTAMRVGIYILVGSLVLFPLVSKLPLAGWDWYYFFYANNPAYNLYQVGSAYPPFAVHIIRLFTWLDWRTSLAFLNSMTILAISLATWKNGGKYKEIAFALTTPPLWFLMWIGHPDGLVLIGLITGIVPLILMKPILSIFWVFSSRKLFAWSVLFFGLSNILWPFWFFSLKNATIGHEAAMGWADLGWPLLIIGFFLMIGAGCDPYRLMAAGCFVTPYLMPYHLAILTPAIGKTRGWRQIVLWFSTWFVFLGTGSSKTGHLFSLIFPLAVYFMCGPLSLYGDNIRNSAIFIKSLFQKIRQLDVHQANHR